ncbi:MAG: hypothetical protein DRQ01_00860 [Ignavibacteriae bacterium]|nr:MAG: hypothetical protein DRQ01_00860 [Ignavibacteriota bacterium]
MTSNATKKLLKAKALLVLDFPFYGMLILRFKYIETMEIGSAGVDGKSLFYNPGFIDMLDVPTLTGLLAHEVLHICLGHHIRRYDRDPKKWNYACDFAIDPLVKASHLPLPNVQYMGKTYIEHIDPKFANMTADHIYTLLKDPPTLSFGTGGMGEIFDFPDLSNGANNSPDEDQNQKQLSRVEHEAIAHKEGTEWKILAQQAATAAKMAGKLPADLEQLIEKINEPQINWIAVLRSFMTDIRADDYDWSRPNRRHICNDLYLPRMHSVGMGEVIIAVDTSGSITQQELEQFAGELNSILGDVKPSKVYVVYCDARVQSVEEFEPDDFPVKLHKKGGGGTDFAPPFAWAEKNANNPACFVYLTDLEGPCNTSRPQYPVLWVVTTSLKDIPFGQLLPLQMDG